MKDEIVNMQDRRDLKISGKNMLTVSFTSQRVTRQNHLQFQVSIEHSKDGF